VKQRLLLIDGDVYAYRYAAAAETAYDWGDGQWTLHANEITAWENMRADIEHTLVQLEADKLVVCLSDDNRSYRREKIFPGYKSNRKGMRKPMILAALKHHLATVFESKSKDWLEADDVMGVIQTNPLLYPEYEKIIVSTDKDMLTIPGLVWQMKFKDKKPDIIHVTEELADYQHRVQTLTGDTTDGYPGCKGIGAVGAARIATEGWDAVRAAFTKAGHDEEFFLSQARCARILRATDYDYVKKEPIPWSLPAPTAPASTSSTAEPASKLTPV
jgi:DNA polymerase I